MLQADVCGSREQQSAHNSSDGRQSYIFQTHHVLWTVQPLLSMKSEMEIIIQNYVKNTKSKEGQFLIA